MNMRSRSLSVLLAGLFLPLLSLFGSAQTAEELALERDAERLAEVEQLLADSQPTAALEKIQRALEDAPESPMLLDGAARVSLALGKEDLALWYTKFGLASIGEKSGREEKALGAEFEARITELDPRAQVWTQALDEYADQVFRLGQAAKKKKLWANAVDLFMRTRGTAFEERGDQELEKIFKSGNSAEAIVDSGLPIPARETRKTAAGIAAYDKKYEEWEKAAKSREFYTKQYKVHSNLGWEIGMRIANTMEQLNKHLRIVYQHKLSGKPLKSCTIDVYSEFDDFKRIEDEAVNDNFTPGTGGFFAPWQNRISTYDQSTVGRDFSDLWGTLFHEGSHQFKNDITSNLIPAWVNEGVACYMEGSKLMPNGVMVANLVPGDRIEPLVQMMGPEWDEDGELAAIPTIDDTNTNVRDFLTYFQPGSYSGQYYPWGWGFVYFIQNFEDENGELVYVPYFKEYIDTYSSGGDHSVMDRWLEYFVEMPEREGIESLDDWYEQWSAWMMDLWSIHSGGEEQADVLCAKGERQLKLGKPERAFESFSWALRKNEDSVRAMWGLAQTKRELDQDDGAAYFLRQTMAWCDAQADAEADISGLDFSVKGLREAALTQVGEINSNLVEGAGEAEQAFRAKALELADQYVEAGQPQNAGQMLKEIIRVVGPVNELVSKLDELAETHEFSLRRARRPIVDDELSHWEGGFRKARWSKIEDGLAVEGRGGFSYLIYDEAPELPYRLEAKLTYEGGDGWKFFGVAFGDSLSGRQTVGWLDASLFGKLEFKPTGLEITDAFTISDFDRGDSVEFALELAEGQANLFLDDEEVGSVPISRLEAAGRIGFVSNDASAKFENIRILY